MQKQRTEITIETHSVTTIRTKAGGADLVQCLHCGQAVNSFTDRDAALVFGIAAIDAAGVATAVHRANNAQFCGNALAEYFNRKIQLLED